MPSNPALQPEDRPPHFGQPEVAPLAARIARPSVAQLSAASTLVAPPHLPHLCFESFDTLRRYSDPPAPIQSKTSDTSQGEAYGLPRQRSTLPLFKNTWDFLVAQGYGKPETRRLPYDDYGLITVAAVTGSGVAQAGATASYDASTSGLVAGDFVFLEFGLANEEHVNLISVDMVN